MSHIWVVEYLDYKNRWMVDNESNISFSEKEAQKDMLNIKSINPNDVKFRIRKYKAH